MDREKVIADIEEQIAWIQDNDFHKFPGWGHAVLAMKDAIALLKEQRAEIDHLNRFINGISRYAMPIVRCKDCKHRPKDPNLETYENGFDIEFPEDSKCPCQCSSDRYYSWCPDDDWFCAEGERRTD